MIKSNRVILKKPENKKKDEKVTHMVQWKR